jgi:glycosyltransferase involved in cell wall biosynthesis
MTAPSVLVITMAFAPKGDTNPWLVDDLVAALVDNGATVDVLVHDVAKPRPRGVQHDDPRLRVLSLGPEAPTTGIRRLAEHCLAGLRYRSAGRRVVGDRTYDLAIFFSPAFLSGFYPNRLRRTHRAKHIAFVLWDFFPIHQSEVGRLGSSPALRPLKWLERKAIEAADTICVMTPANERFLSSYHPGLPADVAIVPPWGGDSGHAPGAASQKPEPEDAEFTLVFGGQLTMGRGVETLIEAAALLQDRATTVRIVVAGSGPHEARLHAFAAQKNVTTVEFLGWVPRQEYLDLLTRAHAGLAITVPNVSIPSFPSKIVDYFRMGVPAILSLEKSSDVGAMISATGAALSVEAGDPEQLADAIARLQREWVEGGLGPRREAALRYFREELSSDVAARRILALSSSTRGTAAADSAQ